MDEQMNQQNAAQTEIAQRAQMEIQMLNRTAEKKKMKEMIKPKIGTEQIRKASQILRKYKEGKTNLEKKIIANEQFWKLRQWNYMNAPEEACDSVAMVVHTEQIFGCDGFLPNM